MVKAQASSAECDLWVLVLSDKSFVAPLRLDKLMQKSVPLTCAPRKPSGYRRPMSQLL